MNRRDFMKTLTALGIVAIVPSAAKAKGKWHHVYMTFDKAEDRYVHVAIDGQWVTATESWEDAWEAVTFVDYYVDERQLDRALSLEPPKVKDGGCGVIVTASGGNVTWGNGRALGE